MEYKFRAWDKENKVMENDITGQVNFDYIWHCNDFVKMMYTGLKDKNRVEIYEGDIVKRTCDLVGAEDDGFIGLVKFECAAFMLESLDGKTGRYLWDDVQELEVIGNIREGGVKSGT